ncbi:MAG: S41 family peptidase, partial [Actinomycetota bacterium]|nr:S41 family peptidase [Actinomycetota bacterium]
LIHLWTTLMTDVYVHSSQKLALYGFDPVRALAALRRQIPFLDSSGFLRELTLLINRLRDQHTQLYVSAADGSLDGYVASLPLLVEVCGQYLDPTYVVTKISEELDPAFTVGVELTSWNGVPFRRAVDLFAQTLTGGRPDAGRARALEVLTQRPLEYLQLPDEQWVEIGYCTEPPNATDHTIRLEWRLVAPGDTLIADDPLSARTRKGINATSEAARRARKLLFATELWQHDRTKKTPAAKAPEWLETTLPDAISARKLRTPSGTVGYLRLWTFDVANSKKFVDEVARVLGKLPRRRLIIDLRSNPGGYIETAESLLQLFTPNLVQPARFACRATPAMAAIAEADGNGPDLADWAESTRAAVNLGEEYSQHLPLTDSDTAEQIQQQYRGRVVAIIDANTFSCGDLFAAGLADHNIATLVAVGEGTGAGGANVWDSDSVAYAYHAARQTLLELPEGVSYSIAVRRMTRTGASEGRAIEDVGVIGDEQYTMTRTDLLDGNSDLIAFCGEILARA